MAAALGSDTREARFVDRARASLLEENFFRVRERDYKSLVINRPRGFPRFAVSRLIANPRLLTRTNQPTNQRWRMRTNTEE